MAERLDWDDLRFFLAVARTGRISAAGRRLGTDHATVWRRIVKLEGALGAKLFERNPRGYNLTQSGERLLGTAQAVESEILRGERTVATPDLSVAGSLRISSLEGFGNFFLASRLPRFATAHPALSVELITIQQIVALSRREADLAVTLKPPESGRFQVEKLTDYRLLVYATEDYLAQAPPIRSPADLTAHRFAGYIDELVFMRGLDYLDEVAEGVKARLQSSSLHAQLEMTAQGFGLCVLPAYIAAHRPELRPVLPDQLSLRRTYWLVAHDELAETARLRAAHRFITAEVAAAAALFSG